MIFFDQLLATWSYCMSFFRSLKRWFRGMSLWTRCMNNFNNSRLEKKKAGNQRLGVQAGRKGGRSIVCWSGLESYAAKNFSRSPSSCSEKIGFSIMTWHVVSWLKPSKGEEEESRREPSSRLRYPQTNLFLPKARNEGIIWALISLNKNTENLTQTSIFRVWPFPFLWFQSFW